MQPQRITVIGAGLVGSLLGLGLAKRGHQVTLYERRKDLRQGGAERGRSINLIMTSRGREAVKNLGVAEEVKALTVPVFGRQVHDLSGEQTYQPYGRELDHNDSVSRGELNALLLDEAEKAGAKVVFETKIVDWTATHLVTDAGESLEISGPLLCADGANSAIRPTLAKKLGVSESIEPLGHGYKEMEIPAGENGQALIREKALHIWPRGRQMLMALPNRDASFTVTLYLPDAGELSFEEVNTGEKVRQLFDEQFSNSVPLIENLEQSYLENPTGVLGTVRCEKWTDGERVLLLGDAAHGIVPFFGQGMNSGFEDCECLLRLVDQENDWSAVMAKFVEERRENAEAIAQMSIENFYEMCIDVGDPQFQFRKRVERELESRFPERYRARYGLVTYSLVPYQIAFKAGEIQKGMLKTLCQDKTEVSEIDWSQAEALLESEFAPFAKTHGLSFE